MMADKKNAPTPERVVGGNLPNWANGHTASTPERVLSGDELCRLLNINRSTLWRMCQRGQFPKPLHISANRRGWPESDYQNWLEAQKAARNGEVA